MTQHAHDGVYEKVLSLLTRGGHLSDKIRKQVLAMGDAAVMPLIEILEDEDLHPEDSRGSGWAPIHAAALLAEMKAERAIEPMLKVLGATDCLYIIHDTLITGLGGMGVAALEPALEAYAQTDDDEFRRSLCCVLSRLGVIDARIFQALIELLVPRFSDFDRLKWRQQRDVGPG